MKKNRNLLCGLLAISAIFGASSAVLAQTCASPNALTVGASGTDNTCISPTGTGANTIGQYCGVVGSPETEIIYQVTLGATATGNFAVTNVQSGFNPAIVLFTAADATACLVASNCIGLPSDSAGASNGTAGSGNETLTFASPGAGSYYIAVTGSPGSGTCGSYGWLVTGPLPVKLQNFSVQ